MHTLYFISEKFWIKLRKKETAENNRPVQITFLWMNTLFWSLAALTLSLLSCVLLGAGFTDNGSAILLSTSYAGVVLGYFGGILYLCRNT